MIHKKETLRIVKIIKDKMAQHAAYVLKDILEKIEDDKNYPRKNNGKPKGTKPCGCPYGNTCSECANKHMTA